MGADATTADRDTVVWLHDLLNNSEAAAAPTSRIDPNWNPMKQDFHKPENVLQTGNLAGNPPDPITQDRPPKICKFFRFNGKCVAGQRCQNKHIQTGRRTCFGYCYPTETLTGLI